MRTKYKEGIDNHSTHTHRTLKLQQTLVYYCHVPEEANFRSEKENGNKSLNLHTLKNTHFAEKKKKVAFEMQRKLVITPISKGLPKVTVNPVKSIDPSPSPLLSDIMKRDNK